MKSPVCNAEKSYYLKLWKYNWRAEKRVLKTEPAKSPLRKSSECLEYGLILRFSSENPLYILNILDFEDKIIVISLKSYLDQATIEHAAILLPLHP